MSFPIDIREEAGVRYLHFGSDWIQGAMRIARPWHLELEYIREMMTTLLLRDAPRRVLIIGLGAASLTKFLYRHYPLAHLTVVEIQPAVVAAARQFFKLPQDDKRIHLVIGNGVEFIQSSDKHYDLILVDGYDEEGHSAQLEMQTFYQACRAHLSQQGILAANLLTRNRSFSATCTRIASVFETRALILPLSESGNAIALAAAGNPIELTLDEIKDNALALKEQTGLNLLPTLVRLTQARTCLNNTLML
jgi:spermidine synthase